MEDPPMSKTFSRFVQFPSVAAAIETKQSFSYKASSHWNNFGKIPESLWHLWFLKYSFSAFTTYYWIL